MRRTGRVPGILYGRGRDPKALTVNERELRATIKAGHALFDLTLGGDTLPVMIKDQQHHPVRGDFVHIDLLEVDLKQKITSQVAVEVVGGEDAPGVVQGGVLDHVTRELSVEALPTDIPDSIVVDVSGLELNATFMLSEATIPSGLTVLDDPDETVIATILPPTKVEAVETVEEETEVVGEGEKAEAAEDQAAEGDGGE